MARLFALAALAIVAGFPAATIAFVHDQILPHHTPIDCPCAPWTRNASSAAYWASQTTRAAADTNCALPALAIMPDGSDPEYTVSDGWCYCDKDAEGSADAPWYTWCSPPAAYPSQINLLLVNASSVVANFVTADGGARAAAPVEAQLRLSGGGGGGATTTFDNGFSTLYEDSTRARRLSYHHVALGPLQPRTRYEYRVRAGARAGGTGAGASEWSEWIGFRSLYDGGDSDAGPTRFAIYGDMGAFPAFDAPGSASPPFPVPAPARHNVGNLVDDLATGRIDFIIHSGDHARRDSADHFSRLNALFFTAMAWVFIPAYCFALP